MSKSKKDFKEFSIEFNIIPDTLSMKSVLTTSNPIHFIPNLTNSWVLHLQITHPELTLLKNQS